MQEILILAFKTVNNVLPPYLRDLFIIRENIKNLRGTNKLVIAKVNTTRYGTTLNNVEPGRFLVFVLFCFRFFVLFCSFTCLFICLFVFLKGGEGSK